MEKTGIITDEGADLPEYIVKENGIETVPVKLDWPELAQASGQNTFQKMRDLEKRGIQSFGKTSQPSPKDFLDKYKVFLTRYEKIICITLTSKLSGTYNSAMQAKNFLAPEEQARIFVIDSLNASAGQAVLVQRAVNMVKAGKEAGEIAKELEVLIPQVKTYIMIKDPKWLETSGRITSMKANILRSLAKIGIRALLEFKDGILEPVGLKMRATDIVTPLFKQFESDANRLSAKKTTVVVTHGDDLQDAQRLKEMVEKNAGEHRVVFMNLIDNVIGAITGPDTMVLAWAKEQ